MPDPLDRGPLRSLDKLCFAQPLCVLLPLRQESRYLTAPLPEKIKEFWEKSFSLPAGRRLLFRIKRNPLCGPL